LKQLTILHIGDKHGMMHADPFIAHLKREAGDNVLVLDSGDTLHTHPISLLTQGESMVNLMNEVGYDAMVPGNHDFAYGSDRLLELEKQMKFHLLAANVDDAVNGILLLKAHHLFTLENGLKVGVFGLANPETPYLMDAGRFKDIHFCDPVRAAKVEVAALKEQGADIIIALTHLGMKKKQHQDTKSHYSDKLARQVPGLDFIIDGHGHCERINVIDNVVVSSVGSKARKIGKIEVHYQSDMGIASIDASILRVPYLVEGAIDDLLSYDLADQGISKWVIDQVKTFQTQLDEPLCDYEHDLWDRPGPDKVGETNLANLVTDSMLNASGADIAIANAGCLRAPILASKHGRITLQDAMRVLPFGNEIVKIHIKGSDLRSALQGIGAQSHIAGLRYEVNLCAPDGEKISNIQLSNGNELSDDEMYTVATLERSVTKGKFPTVVRVDRINLLDIDAFTNYLKGVYGEPSLREYPERRITVTTCSQHVAKGRLRVDLSL